jgi:hypothetical protein
MGSAYKFFVVARNKHAMLFCNLVLTGEMHFVHSQGFAFGFVWVVLTV